MLKVKSILFFLTVVGLLLASVFSCNLKEYPPCVSMVKIRISSLDSTHVRLTADTIDTEFEYLWLLSNGEQSGQPIFEPKNTNEPKEYKVVLKVSAFGCEMTDTASFTIGYPRPKADFSFEVPMDCFAPCTVQFNNISENDNAWKWHFSDDGSTSEVENPTHEFKKAGTFTVMLIASGPGGSDTLSKEIVIKAETFQYTFTIGTNSAVDLERVYGVDQSPTGGYYVAVNNRKQTFLVKTDKQGIPTLPNPTPISPSGTFIGTYLNQFGKIPGGYLMTGYTQFSSNEIFFYALKANGSFNFVGQIPFIGSTVTGDEFGYGFSETNNSQYLFCGQGKHTDSSGLFLIKSSTGLTEGWHKHLTINEPNAYIAAVLNYPSGYVIAGKKKNGDNYEAFFWKLNQNFTPVNQPVFLGTTFQITKIIALDGDHFILLGNDSGTGRIVNIDTFGVVSWDQPYNGWKWSDIMRTADNRLIAVGTFTAASNQAGWMEVKPSDGIENSSESYPLPPDFTDTFATCVAQTADGGFIIGGYGFTASSQQQNLLIKIDPNGKLNN